MILSRPKTRMVAFLAGILFFLCQSAAAAQACFAVPQQREQPHSTATQMPPCHGAGEQTGTSPEGTSGSCHHLSPAPTGFHVVAMADLPAVTIHTDLIAAVAAPAMAYEPPLMRVEPPPHSIVHCCLRN
jgi:hypothetical protein